MDKFVEKNSAKHPIVIEEGDSAQTFEIKGYPTAFLIAPNGKILAQNPQEAQIEEALAKVRLAPELPKALASVEAALKKEKYAEVRGKVAKLIEGGTLVEADKTAAEELVKWIDFLAQSTLDNARDLGEKGDWLGASLALQDAVKAFAGLPQAKDADAQLKAILADKTKKDEITAAKRLNEAKTKQREDKLKPKEALPLFKAIAGKYGETKAGKSAKKIADELEAALK